MDAEFILVCYDTKTFMKQNAKGGPFAKFSILVFSLYTVKQATFDLHQKETGSKTVAIATSKYASCFVFLSVQRACQIPIILHHYLQRYSLLCVLTSILSHLMTSSVSNLHNTNILNISGTRWDMTKRKTPFFFSFKGLSKPPIFQYLNFSFHRHFKEQRGCGRSILIKHSGHLKTHSGNVENTRLRLVYSTFPSCYQMPFVFYHNVIHGLGFFPC